MKTEIITIGDELMSGDVTDTNFSWLAECLWNAGYELAWHTTIADRPELMGEAFQRALRSDLVIVTGGLGPTSDDRTLAVAAESFGRELVLDEAVLAEIEKLLKSIGRNLNDAQRKQAYHPAGGAMFPNRKGTAPGCRLRHEGTEFIFLVGVPSEMHEQWNHDVIPFLESLAERPKNYQQRIFRCFGAPEAELEEALQDFQVPDIRLSYRLKFPEILIKTACWGDEPAASEAALAQAETFIRSRIDRFIYACDDNPIEKVIGTLLAEQGETLAIAESCTGGMIANKVTDVPGASRYFVEGVVSYSNESKQQLLAVKQETIDTCGAVSAETARAMAAGVRASANTTYGLAVTGIAGPKGGTPEKPVGTVHVALATPSEIKEKKYHFPYGRHYFKQVVAHVALQKLRRALLVAKS